MRQRRLAVLLASWCFWYAAYRAYYALGGHVGMIGQPVSEAQFRTINAIGAVIILLAGMLPIAALYVRALRRLVPVLGWVGAVGCCMHAVVDGTLRVLSITGVHPTQLPARAWRTFDRAAADWQDLLLNEPWFFVTGVLWAAFAIGYVRPRRRRGWTMSVVLGVVLLTIVGVLSGLGVVGSFHLG